MFLVVHLLLLPATVSFGASSGDIQRWEKRKDIDRLIRALGNKDSAVREAAAMALGRMGGPRAVDPLVDALGDPLDGVRDAAAAALKNLNEPLGELVQQSLHGSEAAREELARRNDPRAVAPLVKALGAWSMSVRASAARTLGSIGDPRAVEPLIGALGDEFKHVREAAAWALVKVGDGRAVDPMIKALDDSHEPVREAAAYCLGNVGGKRAVEPLIRALQDWYFKVREAAVWALGKLGDPRAVKPLVLALRDNHGAVREAAVWTLGKFGDRQALEPLLKMLDDPDPKVRLATAKVLEVLGDPLGRWITDALAGSMEAENELIRRKDPRSLYPLIRSLESRDGQVRRAAARILGGMRDPRAADGLIAMAGGWNLKDRLVASAALWKMDQKFYPGRLATIFHLLARPASVVYSFCIGCILFLTRLLILRIVKKEGGTIG